MQGTAICQNEWIQRTPTRLRYEMCFSSSILWNKSHQQLYIIIKWNSFVRASKPFLLYFFHHLFPQFMFAPHSEWNIRWYISSDVRTLEICVKSSWEPVHQILCFCPVVSCLHQQFLQNHWVHWSYNVVQIIVYKIQDCWFTGWINVVNK